MKGKIENFEEVVNQLKTLNSEIGKLGIFDYDTLDEAKPKEERLSERDLRIHISGPSAAISLKILTRKEHTILKDTIVEIIDRRYKRLNDELNNLCKERLSNASRRSS